MTAKREGISFMKKNIFAFSLVFISVFCFAKEIAVKTEPCEFKEISLFETYRPKTFLSYEELNADIDMLCYILSCGYAGYEDMLSRGFDLEKFQSGLLGEFKDKTEIETRRFYFSAKEKLIPYINDAHFQLINFYDIYSFCEKEICFWTNIFVRKNENGEYFVAESKNGEVKTGEKYADSLENLFYYPCKSGDIFRLGIMSSGKAEKSDFQFEGNDGKTYRISAELFDDGAIEVRPMKYKEFESSGSAYIALNSFMIPAEESPSRKAAEIVFEKFINSGKKYNGKGNIIIDLRGNQGGESMIPGLFLYSLHADRKIKNLSKDYKKAEEWFSSSFSKTNLVFSPVFVQADYMLAERRGLSGKEKRKYSSYLKKIKENPERIVLRDERERSNLFDKESRFKGKLIFLTDRNSVSAAEIFVLMAKEIFGNEQVFVLGENTYGMASYWNVITIELPNSRIGVHTAFTKNLAFEKYPEWHGEGYGIYPNCWTLGSDLNETIFFLTGDKEMKEKLKDIEFRLQ